MMDDNVVVSFKPKAVNIICNAEASQFYFFIPGLFLSWTPVTYIMLCTLKCQLNSW